MTTLLASFAPSTPALPARVSPPAPAGPIDDRAERVARGAALLDRVRPSWADVFGPKQLRAFDMARCDACALGMVYGNFYTGIGYLIDVLSPEEVDFWADSRRWAYDHGFVECNNDDDDYPALRCLWVTAILARRRVGTGTGSGR